MSYFLTIEDVKNICYDYAKAHLTHDEPFSLFEEQYEGMLETALFSPQKSFSGKMVYSTLPEQAAVLFYNMIKLHPFFNGNKRIACVSLLVFLAFNQKWISTDWQTLYKMAKDVASSDAKGNTETIKILIKFINATIKDP